MGIGQRLARYAEYGKLAVKVGASWTDRLEQAREVASSLGKLRGAAMKFGQTIAVAAEHLDVPEEVRQALGSLHSQGEPVPWDSIRGVVTRELGPISKRFATFDEKPLGTASLAQAHAATLPDGTPVVVKVLHDGVEESVEADLSAFRALLAAWRLTGRDRGEVDDLVAEVRERLREELDYGHEAANIEAFVAIYGDDPRIRIPRVHREWSTSRVLTLDRLPGRPIEAFAADASDEARIRAGLNLAELFFEQAFCHRMLHADPHPGNYLFEADGRIGLLDFGCVKRFSAPSMSAYMRIVRCALENDRAGALQATRDFGAWNGDTPAAGDAVWAFCDAVVGPWRNGPYQVGADDDRLIERVHPAVKQMWAHAEIRGPRDVIFLHRTLAGIYGLGRKLKVKADWKEIVLEQVRRAEHAAA
jgi:aarF domain-containing kinase